MLGPDADSWQACHPRRGPPSPTGKVDTSTGVLSEDPEDEHAVLLIQRSLPPIARESCAQRVYYSKNRGPWPLYSGGIKLSLETLRYVLA